MKTSLILSVLLPALIIFGSVSNAAAFNEYYTVSPGKVYAKSVYLSKGDTIDYGVKVNGGNNNDINFRVTAPSGITLITYTVYSSLTSNFVAENTGTYRFLFDNKMSYVSSKSVQFYWEITKPVLGISQSQSGGGIVFGAEWIYVALIVIIVIGIVVGVTANKKKKRKGTDYSGLIDEDNDNKPSIEPPKKSFWEKCFHTDSWVREDRMEICSSCGKELGKRLGTGEKSEAKEESKTIEVQQNLDNYVAQSKPDDSVKKETINDIEKNEIALGIIKERLAKGELSVKEFQELKKEISS